MWLLVLLPAGGGGGLWTAAAGAASQPAPPQIAHLRTRAPPQSLLSGVWERVGGAAVETKTVWLRAHQRVTRLLARHAQQQQKCSGRRPGTPRHSRIAVLHQEEGVAAPARCDAGSSRSHVMAARELGQRSMAALSWHRARRGVAGVLQLLAVGAPGAACCGARPPPRLPARALARQPPLQRAPPPSALAFITTGAPQAVPAASFQQPAHQGHHQQQQQARPHSNRPEHAVYVGPSAPSPRRVTLRTLRDKYNRGVPISMVTAYDYPSAVHVSWPLAASCRLLGGRVPPPPGACPPTHRAPP